MISRYGDSYMHKNVLQKIHRRHVEFIIAEIREGKIVFIVFYFCRLRNIKEYNPSNFIDYIQRVLFDVNVRKQVTDSCTKIS